MSSPTAGVRRRGAAATRTSRAWRRYRPPCEERLVGLKHVRTDKTTHAIAEGLSIEAKTPVLEVYLRDAPGDERQVAALAPPWSTVPWHLLALMEEAVVRGYAAFSREEAARREVAWLDLVRDPTLRAKLLDLIAAFEREGYRPAAAEGLRDRRGGAGALALAQGIRREERASPGHQRSLPAEGSGRRRRSCWRPFAR